MYLRDSNTTICRSELPYCYCKELYFSEDNVCKGCGFYNECKDKFRNDKEVYD